ncbi:RNA exonuclease 1 homolog [Ochotona princeps]|uniref:RNA exonuclease 1 homolog n=1 Tax=Ochotona princeps TaxID=9978 RepID=UPI002714C04A|nr:RNA exonuclease 1 homolog [Ochotona princeps]
MLRSTGFFRAIDCPYWAGEPGGPCRRPYCHFRHRGARGLGAPGGGAASPAAGLCYDPCNPELPKPPTHRENGALGREAEPRADMLELELVNKAIEAVRSEVELLETARELGSDEASALAPHDPDASPASPLDEDAFQLAFDYNPGGCGYQPTPLATPSEPDSKYSLAALEQGQGRAGRGNGALEYVPKAVSQPRRYSRTTSSSKYVLDDSKPSTDLEYDPLSNYSARHLSRSNKRPRGSRAGEAYSPALKRPCEPLGACEARFSDSDDDASLAPASPHKAGAESKPPGKPASKEGSAVEGSAPRETKEMAVQYDVEDLGHPPGKPGSPARTPQDRGSPREGKPKKKRSGVPPASGPKDSTRKKDKMKDRDRGGSREGLGPEKKGQPASSPRPRAELPEVTKKKPFSAGPAASSGKGGRPDRPGHQLSPTSSPRMLLESKGGTKTPSGKLAGRKARSLDEGTSRDAPKLKKRALSHADLFGDESGDEDPGPGPGATRGWPPALPNLSSDSDSDSDSSSPGHSPPKRLKASPPPPAPASPSSSSSSEDLDYSALEKEVAFDSDPMEECLRIFNEPTPEGKGRLAPQPPKEDKSQEKGRTDPPALLPGQRRRIAHLAKQGKEGEPLRRGPMAGPPARPPTAQEVCYRRAQQAQKESASLLQAAPRLPEKPSSVHISAPGEKRRIAHVPNPRLATAPAGAKRTTPAASSNSQAPPGPEPGRQPLKTRTLAGMASKTTTPTVPKRVAHSPSLQSLKKPIIPKEFGGKVPTAIRQRYLNMFLEECLKSCSSSEEAVEKALSEEKVAYDRSPSKNIYLNVAVNTLKKLRGLVPNAVPSLSKTSGRKVVSHEMVLGGRLAAKTSFSLNRPSSPRVEDLKGAALYSRLREYLLTEEQLKENGYPFPHPDRPGGAVIFTAEEKRPKDPSCRICCRCGAEYLVSSSGRCIRDEECYYHWGRLRRNRVAGGWETQYMCCSTAIGSMGCQVAKQHVQDGRKDCLEGFVKTFEKEVSGDAHAGIFALDCEMSYTTFGLELTRVTVVDTDMQVVYDTFVKPDNEIVDYNTRFSGVTEADLADVSITLRDVQAVLLSMFSADTILIGHSLQSDLLALKVIHRTVVDTSVLFPHRLGLPYKRSLRNLMADCLRQIIQDNVDGHSSSEDASACMHLLIWKIREDAKTKR